MIVAAGAINRAPEQQIAHGWFDGQPPGFMPALHDGRAHHLFGALVLKPADGQVCGGQQQTDARRQRLAPAQANEHRNTKNQGE